MQVAWPDLQRMFLPLFPDTVLFPFSRGLTRKLAEAAGISHHFA
jgi:hypothetical protein